MVGLRSQRPRVRPTSEDTAIRTRTVVATGRAVCLRDAVCQVPPLQANRGGAGSVERWQTSQLTDVSPVSGGLGD